MSTYDGKTVSPEEFDGYCPVCKCEKEMKRKDVDYDDSFDDGYFISIYFCDKCGFEAWQNYALFPTDVTFYDGKPKEHLPEE